MPYATPATILPRRLLVIGGAGFVGSNLALRLARDGHHVVAADTFEAGTWQNLADFAAAGGDVLALDHALDVDSMRRLSPFDAIFHQAAITGVVDADGTAQRGPAADRRMLRNNVEQFRQILDWAGETGAAVVWASSCSVYGRGPRADARVGPGGPAERLRL